MNNVDINVQRAFSIGERVKFEFSTDFINAFNRVQYDNPNTEPASNNFGKVRAQWNTPRWIQVKGRMIF